MSNKLLAALVSLILTACGNPMTPPGEDLSGSSQAKLRLGAAVGPAKLNPKLTATLNTKREPTLWAVQVSDTATNPVFTDSFLINSTYDLYFAFDIPVALAGQHIAAFEIISPDGSVYQRNEVPFTSGSSTQYRVWTSMPVAGTWVQQFAMSGSWSVRAYLDGESVSRASKTFLLQ